MFWRDDDLQMDSQARPARRSIVKVVTAAATPRLGISLADMKTRLDITGTDSDARLNLLIPSMTAVAEAYCGRIFAKETVEETFYGWHGRQSLWLSRYPVESISTITDNETSLTETDFDLADPDHGELRRNYGSWPSVINSVWGGRKIVVTYVGGYDMPDDVPPLLADAIGDLVHEQYYARSRDPAVRTETTEGVGSTQYLSAPGGAQGAVAVSASIADKLGSFVRLVVG